MAKRRGNAHDYLIVVPVLLVAALLTQVGPSFDVLEWVTMIGIAALIVASVLGTVWFAYLSVMGSVQVFGGLVAVGVGGLETVFTRKFGERWGLPCALAVASALALVGIVSVLHLLVF